MQTDAELVASARSGDREGLSAIYDRYADRLYDLYTSVLRDPDAAFDAMVDTFVIAALELYRLRRPDKLEAWLFALARSQLLAREIPIGVDEHAEFDGTSAVAAADGAGAIVWEAVSWFPGRDRVLLDMHARQPLDGRALADVMGVSPPHALALVRDLDDKMQRMLSALLVARLARPGCAHMKKLIASEDEHHPDAWLRHTALHVDVCRSCLLWREDQPNTIELIAGVPAEPAPPEVRAEVLDRVDLLWSALGPPEWTATVLGSVPTVPATEDATEASLSADDAEAEAFDPAEAQDADRAEATDQISPIEAATDKGDDQYDEQHYDEYDEVESLVPPPPRLRRSGFPRSMYPSRRRCSSRRSSPTSAGSVTRRATSPARRRRPPSRRRSPRQRPPRRHRRRPRCLPAPTHGRRSWAGWPPSTAASARTRRRRPRLPLSRTRLRVA